MRTSTPDTGRIFIFLGPSMSRSEAQAILPDAVILPPAGLGDIYAVTKHGPVRAIGLIDGRFQLTPAVWHKEIMHAMSLGIPVYGAASMGALRACELHALGMRGVGRIFEQYSSGALEDDDEVALLHAPSEMGYRPVTYAMASLRHAIACATRAALIDSSVAQLLCTRMKALHYTLRTRSALRSMLDELVEDGAAALAFLDAPEQDLKRRDAIELLQRLSLDGIEKQEPSAFEVTSLWQRFVEQQDGKASPLFASLDATVCNEYLRLREGKHASVEQEAWIETVETLLAGHLAMAPESTSTRQHLEVIRRKQNLMNAGAVQSWLNERKLTRQALHSWAESKARSQMLRTALHKQYQQHLTAAVARAGTLETMREELVRRDQLGPKAIPEIFEAEQVVQLCQAYRDDFNGVDAPLEVCANTLGFDGAYEFLRALLREQLADATPVQHGQHEHTLINTLMET